MLIATVLQLICSSPVDYHFEPPFNPAYSCEFAMQFSHFSSSNPDMLTDSHANMVSGRMVAATASYPGNRPRRPLRPPIRKPR